MNMNKEIYVTTLRCNTKRETHRKVVEYIEKRDRERYVSVNDYIIAAILNFEDPMRCQNAGKTDIATIGEVIRAIMKEELGSLQYFHQSLEAKEEEITEIENLGDMTKDMSEDDDGLPSSVNNFLESLGV